jgi:hypothetical protein
MACLSEVMVMDLIDRALPSPVRRRAEEHMAACPECRRLVSYLAREALGSVEPANSESGDGGS